VVPLRLAAPEAAQGAVIPALVDTGADCTLVPVAAVDALQLPQIGSVWIQGVGPLKHRATVRAAQVEFGGLRCLADVTAFGDEAILGRDLLNRAVALLDGPGLALSLTRRL
jgi:predicted aspartyl protease